jgi:Fe2+ transport system protein FeoA
MEWISQVINLKIGAKARITAISAGDPVYRQRLIALGLLPGTEFSVIRVAPLGDPIEILVRGFALSLRRHEASILKIEEIAA